MARKFIDGRSTKKYSALLSSLLIATALTACSSDRSGETFTGASPGSSASSDGSSSGDGSQTASNSNGSGTGGGSAGSGSGGSTGGGSGGASAGGSVIVTDSSGTAQRTVAATTGLTGGVLTTTGNALLTTEATSGAGQKLSDTGTSVKDGTSPGSGLLDKVATGVDSRLNPVGKVTVSDQPVVGSANANSSQLIGASALSPTQTQGSLATAGVLSGGQTASASVAGTSVLPNGVDNTLLGADVSNQSIIKASGQPAIAVSATSSETPVGQAATVGLLNGQQPIKAVVNGLGIVK